MSLWVLRGGRIQENSREIEFGVANFNSGGSTSLCEFGANLNLIKFVQIQTCIPTYAHSLEKNQPSNNHNHNRPAYTTGRERRFNKRGLSQPHGERR